MQFVLSFLLLVSSRQLKFDNLKLNHKQSTVNSQLSTIIVAQNGSGNFKTIQAAIESVKDSVAAYSTVIFIKSGTYREKIYLKKNGLTLRGEFVPKNDLNWRNATGVKIIYSEAREIFRARRTAQLGSSDTVSGKTGRATDDWGGSVINIKANDIKLENLVCVNDYGFEAKGDSTLVIDGKTLVVKRNSHQFALRAMPPCQRLKVTNCNFHSLGGDTVSPWDTENGSYYFKDCYIEGGVDFYCPRGFAYAENCSFYAHPSDAAIWHDGTGNENAKTVLKNCYFDGDPNFKLGRHHRDAQFFLIDCKFSKNMADKPIFQVRKDTTLMWGTRTNYFNCHREGGDFTWFADNISSSELSALSFESSLIINKSSSNLIAHSSLPIADNMLIAQRNIGGWAKTLDGKTQPPPYDKIWDATMRATIHDEIGRNDATIDNKATTREIAYLAESFDETKNAEYKIGAERGIAYLLEMQYPNGGFPQFYPDSSGYRKHITFNDDAMIRALEVLKDVSESKKPYQNVGSAFREKAKKAVERGIDCILKTQIIKNGKPTIWCAQHDYRTLQPTKARSYELPSFSGEESVKIIAFLMAIEKPSPEIKKAIKSAVSFFEDIKITGFKTSRIKDATQKLGEDMIVIADPNAKPMWARFYDLETQKPFFSGRDGVKKSTLAEIENERRIHYAWYGVWPTELLAKKYPQWLKKNQD